MLAQKTRGLYPATQAILEAMVEGALVDFDSAVRIEARKLARVMVGQTAKNMIQAFFFDLQAIRSGKARPHGFAAWRPKKVGVLGAGMMGAGIAHANAARGIPVVLKDVSKEKVEAGLAAIRKVTAPQVAKGRMDALAEAKLLGLVTPTVEAGALDGCDLIIEAVFEKRDVKAQATREAEPMLAQKTRGLYPATQAILEAMVEGALVDFDAAVRIEARKLARVMVGQTAKNMIQAFFFDLQAIRSGKARPQGFAAWKPSKVGILGAGMMGAGIAHANAARGIACVLKDVSAEKAEAGIAAIRKVTSAAVARGSLDAAREAKLLSLVAPSADVRALDGCELIVEAVFENRALKAEVTREAEPMLAADGVFASNTSTLPISGLAEASARPERFVGLHFFSPVHKMKLVEIIRGARTSDETIARAYDYVLALAKTPIVVNDARGFFTSRVFGTYVMEGAAMLAEGIAAPLIEHAALAAGMPVGPLAVLDETSLALSVHVLEQTRADLRAEGREHVASAGERLVEKMVKEFGRPGRVGGAGFYDYPAGAPKRLWPGLATHFAKPGVAADVAELKQRLLYQQSIESARCLAEGVLTSVAEANIGSILGIGFPAWTGGAIQFIASEGRDRFLANAAALAARHGERFALSAETLDRALSRDRS
jgi:3-hydroxyacyl-CoA dehydrogenase/enoyl-CoA hydratase/3-hydroxybutyryl-CoA epimerase